ncbi:MATE family efflux transporter [Photorhabdus heterorhabditis]|uniref:MATE family efflux transporter n=1 Tax=Photorhabdus heterorhabditis TaxID=880156 RepID=UPI0020B7E34B|nr:MATE family efflux transporter [Photorhabdus heterorhabditis]
MGKFSKKLELKQLFSLSLPIIIGQMARTAMSVVDIVMSGHYATADLAAVALGGSIWFPIFVLGYGTIIMLAADVAKQKAQRDDEGIKISLKNYFFLSMILSIPIIFLLILVSKLFSFIPVIFQVASLLAALTHPGHIVLYDIVIYDIVIYAPGDSLPCRRDAS